MENLTNIGFLLVGGLISWLITQKYYKKSLDTSNEQFKVLENNTDKHFKLIKDKTEESIKSQRNQFNKIISTLRSQLELLIPMHTRLAKEASYEADDDQDNLLHLEEDGLYYDEVVDQKTYSRFFHNPTEKCPECNSKSFEFQTREENLHQLIVCKKCHHVMEVYKNKFRENLKTKIQNDSKDKKAE